MQRTYPALVHKDPKSTSGVTFPDFPGCTSGVTFPDFPGCISGGESFEQAREMAREALALHLEGLADDGEPIPPPSSPNAAFQHEDAHDAIALIIVTALPERTEEEAQAELAAFKASPEYAELYESETLPTPAP